MGTVIFNIHVTGPIWAWIVCGAVLYCACGVSFVCGARRLDWPLIGLDFFGSYCRPSFGYLTPGELGAGALFWPLLVFSYIVAAVCLLPAKAPVRLCQACGNAINLICKPK